MPLIEYPLLRVPVQPHRWWQLHKWRDVRGMAGLFGVVRQCSRCYLVEVYSILANESVRGPHTMLVDKD